MELTSAEKLLTCRPIYARFAGLFERVGYLYAFKLIPLL